MKYCYNCGRALADNEQCDCTKIEMSEEMIKNIERNSYDLYSKERMNDLLSFRLIENEKILEKTVSIISELESLIDKLNHAKASIELLNKEYNSLKKVDAGLLQDETVWKTKERYYEILDEIKEKLDNIDK